MASINATSGNKTLIGGTGRDTIDAGAGNDWGGKRQVSIEPEVPREEMPWR